MIDPSWIVGLGVILFGNKCFVIILKSLAPIVSEAKMYSLLLRLKNSALTNLVTPIHDVRPMTIIIFHMEGVRKAITAKIRKNVGIESIMSTNLIIIESTHPR